MIKRRVAELAHKSLPAELGSAIDVFVCCGSFEDRCKSVADAVAAQVKSRAVIAFNRELSDAVGANTEYLFRLFGERAVKTAISTSDPISSADAMAAAFSSAIDGSPKRILADISTFTHETLLILLALLRRQMRKGDELFLAYTNAMEYSLGELEQNKWLSKGVSNVRSVLGYPGEYQSARSTHLIVLVGYEHERASKLIEAIEPSLVTLGYGSSATETSPGHGRANAHFHSLVAEAARGSGAVKKFEFSCSNPWDACEAILRSVGAHQNCNTVVAPMNTKLSTIGAALAAIRNQNIQLCYAEASIYNWAKYSSPGLVCRLLDVTDELRR